MTLIEALKILSKETKLRRSSLDVETILIGFPSEDGDNFFIMHPSSNILTISDLVASDWEGSYE